jgi:arabinofuranosyltransferase
VANELTRKSKVALILLSAFVLIGVFFGWRVFWFLTDDAFIAFRYVSNSQLGYGYVWNPPPFRPVEGYTSFLWVVLLDVIWRVTGREPPAVANVLSLIFAYLTLLIGSLMVMKMSLREQLARHRVVLLAFVLAWVISNRTFLAWTSSGLETALFNFCLTWWVYCCLFLKERQAGWVFGITLSAALLALTRPDGLLFVAATAVLITFAMLPLSRTARLRMIPAATPLLLIPIHLIWRRVTYQAWLPNTYYAKTVSGRFWYQSGLRYLLSFILEYALWIWLIAAVVVLLLEARRFWKTRTPPSINFVMVVVCTSVFGQVFYYTAVIGGDHFEYRVYSQLILLTAISFLWLLNRLQLGLRSTILLTSLFVICSWPIPWIHWAATHNIDGRKRTVVLRGSVAKAIQTRFPSTPNILLTYPRAFDQLQDWLIGHFVCMRHQEHKNFYLYLKETLPSREAGMQLPADGYPVHIASSVGVVSWVLPRVNIIDVLGLNDFVAARNPETTKFIVMAHERRPPDGYIECFAPNVDFNEDHFDVHPREIPLTADKIKSCEQQFEAVVEAPDASKQTLVPVKNPIDERHFFVSQEYRDVLNREPDPNGLDYWSEHLKPCPPSAACFNQKRALIHMVLFSADEFQETAIFAYRLHAAAFGKPASFSEFMQERKQFEVFQVDWRDPGESVSAQRSFTSNWVNRDEFRAAYPDSLKPESFVNQLFDTAQLRPYDDERKRQLEGLRAGKSRSEVLREVVEIDEFKRRENDRAQFVLQFLLHLRRDVDPKDERYQAWQEKLAGPEPVDMRHFICLFLTSDEYQHRFGSEVTHSNSECR